MTRILAILLALGLAVAGPAAAQIEAPAKMIGFIPLPEIEGWFDHISFDVKNQRLFVPAEHKRAIEIIDLKSGKILREVTGFDGNPRRSIYLAEPNQLWVDDGESVKGFNWESYTLIKKIPLALDKGSQQIPDNGAYDAASGFFYVCITADANAATATAKGRVDIIDTKKGELVGSIKVDGVDPAGIAFDAATRRMFVILGDARVQVVDRDTRAVTATWDIPNGLEPHSVGIDTAHHRLFVGSRGKPSHIFKPGRLSVMDTESGKLVQALDTQGGPDEIQYDAANARVYVTGTTGGADVFKQVDPDHYQKLGELITAADAKTSALVPELKRFYVAVPKRSVSIPGTRDVIIEDAKLLIFETP
jgi:hypothetical protein